MHIIRGSCVLIVWLYTLISVTSQDCTLEQFKKNPMYDSNFDTSDMQPRYAAGRQIRVSCNIGYTGFFKLICTENGWTTIGTKCEPKSCGHPGDAQFADFFLEKGNDFVFGSKVVYKCHNGYQMVSRRNYMICMAGGWDGVVPVCEALQCPVIHVDKEVQATGELEEATYGNVVRFSCKSSSHILYGSTEVHCDENGQWSENPPRCEAVKCKVPQIEHGTVMEETQNYNEHAILRFVCDSGYQKPDKRESTCTKMGQRADWSPTPVCEPIKCRLAVSAVDGARYDPPYRNVFSPTETLRVTCGERYWISTPQEVSAETVCGSDGEWSIYPVCREVTCSEPRDWEISYWYSRRTVKLDETVSYYCKDGYKKPGGAQKATCTRNGWSPNPLCQEIACDREDIPNASIQNAKERYKNKERANYVCNKGYSGRFTLTCGERGWTGRPGCTEKTCDRYDIPKTTIINSKNRYRFSEQATYVCTEGYSGRFILTCGDRGWEGIPDKICSECQIPDFPHGFIVGPSETETYSYTCNVGYKLLNKQGWGVATCVDGVWNGLHQCFENTKCGPPPIPNGLVSPRKDIYENGASVQVICEEGYRPEVDELTCREGDWPKEPQQYCTPIAGLCSTPPQVKNAVIVTSYLKEYVSGSEVTYQCRKSYTMEGNNVITCSDGEWQLTDLRCTYVDTSVKCKVPRIEHGTVMEETQDYNEHEILNFVCDSGYQKAEEQNSTCTKMGQRADWSPTPACERIACIMEEMHPNLRAEESRAANLADVSNVHAGDAARVANAAMPADAMAADEATADATAADEVTADATAADEVTADAAATDAVTGHAATARKVNVGHKLKFQCDNGFTLEGPVEIHCLKSGEWSQTFPTCFEKCKIGQLPQGVKIKQRRPGNLRNKGEKLEFTCNKDVQVIQGNATVECLANGQWSHAFPTCVRP